MALAVQPFGGVVGVADHATWVVEVRTEPRQYPDRRELISVCPCGYRLPDQTPDQLAGLVDGQCGHGEFEQRRRQELVHNPGRRRPGQTREFDDRFPVRPLRE